MKRLKVSIEQVRKAQIELRRVNSVSILHIDFTYKGKVILIPAAIRDEWEFTGLNNIDFIEFRITPYGKVKLWGK